MKDLEFLFFFPDEGMTDKERSELKECFAKTMEEYVSRFKALPPVGMHLGNTVCDDAEILSVSYFRGAVTFELSWDYNSSTSGDGYNRHKTVTISE